MDNIFDFDALRRAEGADGSGDPGPRAGAKPGIPAQGPGLNAEAYAALAEESRRHRVLILKRGAVVAVTTLVSIGGAFLLHTVLVGGMVLAWALTPAHRVPNKNLEPASLSGLGTIELEDLSEAPPAPDAANGLPAVGPAVAPAAPALPTLPDITFAPPSVPVVEPAQMPEAIAVPVDEPGSVKVQVPPHREAAAPPSAEAVANVNPEGTGDIDRSDPDRSGEPQFKTTKGDGFGSGEGVIAGFGRGPLAGDRNPGAELPLPSPDQVPEWLRYNPPKHATTFEVVVLADGTLGGVTMVESCGRPEVDAYYLDIVKRGKYRPAYRGGKATTASMQITPNGQMSQ